MSELSRVSGLYTDITLAIDELKSRSNNKQLHKSIDDFFVSCPDPEFLENELYAFWSPAIATPNFETLRFIQMCSDIPAKMLCMEYTEDKFVHLNQQKRFSADMRFCKSHKDIISDTTTGTLVLDFANDQGKPMNQLHTTKGEPFTQFHHRLLHEYLGDQAPQVVDFSTWFQASQQFNNQLPYLRYLGLFLVRGILFTNFTTEKYEKQFTLNVVVPAFNKLKEIFGIAPLIVPVEPLNSDDFSYWCYYPEDIKKLI